MVKDSHVTVLSTACESNRREAARLPDGAGLNAVGEVDRSVEILGEYGSSEAVRRAVGTFYDFTELLELHDLHHWTKDLTTHTHADTSVIRGTVLNGGPCGSGFYILRILFRSKTQKLVLRLFFTYPKEPLQVL